jgi:hypothetical protein
MIKLYFILCHCSLSIVYVKEYTLKPININFATLLKPDKIPTNIQTVWNNNTQNGLRIIGIDKGRANPFSSSELSVDNAYDVNLKPQKSTVMRKYDYYIKTGISRRNKEMENKKPETIKVIESSLSKSGGWKTNNVIKFAETFTSFCNEWIDTLFEYYYDITFRKYRMINYRKKKSYMNQCIREMLKPAASSDKDKDVLIFIGNAKMGYNVKGEKLGGSPTSFFERELKHYINKVTSHSKRRICYMHVTEINTTKKHYQCQQNLLSCKDTSGNILRGWKCCTHCVQNNQHDVR